MSAPGGNSPRKLSSGSSSPGRRSAFDTVGVGREDDGRGDNILIKDLERTSNTGLSSKFATDLEPDSGNRGLVTLSLRGNDLSDPTAKSFAQLLRSRCSQIRNLTLLDLTSCRIQYKGFQQLKTAVTVRSKMDNTQKLNVILEDNDFVLDM
mmetsp:Transcript_22974/g.25985  ORF Transcript_22974/g.25985 Transcript_22974/m.25985 type:complete len:151 (-) Transcript_22974:561-1013(-)